ncbi:mucin-13b isoform X2 [Morone saxatilis]|uniref:mucin-13b isoform X1 n=1 Tax=Morone saxatilis TaxID=34816 RepID=UPI0015E21CE3|nr:mucin-13b isoform X1 [Morone saxatilis]XP_035515056.1 mucin-13b isoform X2 [Morone saxatilis]
MIKTASGGHLSPHPPRFRALKPRLLIALTGILSGFVLTSFPMARELKILCVLWLVLACLATESSRGQTTAPSEPTTSESLGGETTIAPSEPTTSESSGGQTTGPPIQTPGTETTGGETTGPPTQTPSTETTGGETTGPHTQPPPTETPGAGPCYPNPCGSGSTCAPRHNETFVCLCLAGDFYNDGSKICEKAKVFPGQLTLPGIVYDDTMADKKSKNFLDTSKNITEALSVVFEKKYNDYSGSIVLDIRPINKAKVWLRNNDGVITTVEIIFTPSAGIKTEEVLEVMKDASKSSDTALKGSTFKEEKLCDKEPCDNKSTKCSSRDGSFTCECMDNYIKTNFSDRICIACSSGTKADGSSKCVACPFGYSGFNCNESWQLTLVIVGSVLGGLLLITLILLPIVALKSPKKSSKKNKNGDIGTYVTHSPAKAPLVNGNHTASFNGQANSFANAGVPKIPRATTNSSWDNRTNLEMTPSNSRQNLVNSGRNMRQFEDDDDMPPYAQSRPQSSLYAQARPQSSLYAQAQPQNNPYAQDRAQNNPYAQDRPQNNPYASSQGHANPYYMHDNGRRFN